MSADQEAWIKSYLNYLRDVEKKASGTLRDMRSTFGRSKEMMKVIAPGKSLWKCELNDYLQYIDHERERGKSSLSISKQLSHLRGLLNYAWRSGRSDRNVLDGFDIVDAKPSRIEPAFLNFDEARRLISCCGRKTTVQRRDRMIIILLYGCGLRNAELRNMKLVDVDRERQEIKINGKGSKERLIPVSDVVWTELLAYLSDKKWKRGYVFRTLHKSCRMGGHELSSIVRNKAMEAGITMKVTPKTLRHTFATHLMDSGVDISIISSLMGHRSISETGVYFHVLNGKKETAVQQLKLLEDL